jgi:HSP20 family protein
MRYRQVTYAYTLVVQPSSVATQTAWRPAADVYETPTVIRVTVELPGVDPEDVDVSLFENALVVEGQRAIPADLDAGGIYHTAEIRRGSFRAEIALAASVRAETLEMRCERGILSITLSKDTE